MGINEWLDRQTDANTEGLFVEERPPANLCNTTIMSCFGRRAWDPKGKVSCPKDSRWWERITDFLQHCYVTGGSTGLGLALSILLAQQGADVSIVARNENNLKAAIEKLKVRFSTFPNGR